MTSIEEKLCQVCIETFQGMTMSVVVQEAKRQHFDRNGKSLDRIHHQNQSSLVTSKDDGCFICSWLWAKIPPVLRSEEFESSPVRTFCQVSYAFSGSAEIQAHFYSRGPWDGDLELRGASLPSQCCSKMKPCAHSCLSCQPGSFSVSSRSTPAQEFSPSVLERPPRTPLVKG
jgi:hypothetical protein